MENKQTARAGEERIGEQMMIWVNSFPQAPAGLREGAILYGRLPQDAPGMALIPVPGGKTARDILGGREAEFRFRIEYRVRPEDSRARLEADRLLDSLAAWAEEQRPPLGGGLEARKIRKLSRAALLRVHAGGEEDHGILLGLQYRTKGSI